MKNTRLLTLMVLILLIVLLPGCFLEVWPDTPKADQGVLDLTKWDFDRHKTIELDGQWEFYWNRFVDDRELPLEKPDMYVEVPSTWNKYSMDGKKLTGAGCATYGLHVRTDLPEDTMMGLRIYTFSSAYKLYINGKLTAENGRVGANAAEETGEYRPQAVFFSTPAKEFDILIQVSNFQYARGGFWYSIHMGSVREVLKLHDDIMGKEIFLVGALLMISLFYLAVFILIRELRYCLYFACLCLTMILCVDMLGQLVLLNFLPGLSLRFVILIWYSSSIWFFFFLILFVHELFESRFSAAVLKVYLIVAAAMQVVFIFTDPVFYTKYFAQINDFVCIAGALCTVIIVAIGIRKGQKDGWLNIASIVTALFTYIHDDLYWMNIIDNRYGEIIHIGLFIFIFLQMVIQAKRIKLFHEHKTAAELSFLQAQIKPHFLYNAINTFISISRYDIEQARSLLVNFSNYLRGSFDFKDLSQTVPLKSEIELAKAYVSIEKARFEERLEVNFEVCDALEARVPILVLQPVIENAVNHGVLPKAEGGRVDVCIKKQGKFLVFSVKDNGVGMTPEERGNIFKRKFGSGIGLSNIDGRLKRLYGKGIQISSEEDAGTEVAWRIPVK